MKSVYVVIAAICLLSGCDALRFAPSESQKQNAWLHTRTAEFAADAAQRPDLWQVADNGLELGIGIAALFGGVLGTRAVQFLRDAKTKSKALKEIIEGNELFKKQNIAVVDDFKESQKNQSVETRQLVAQMK